MQAIFEFLTKNPILALSICLAVGYCIGYIKIKSFSFGATVGTLVVGFVLSRFATFEIPGILASMFSLFFCFTIGYEAGPAFFKNLKSNGIKFLCQAVFFCVVAFGVLYAIGISGILDKDAVIGMAAGALTQTSILTVADGLGDMAAISYAMTYMTGTFLAILFVSVIGPKIIRTSPIAAAKQKISKSGNTAIVKTDDEDVRLAPVYPRAFRVDAGSKYIGKTVEELEDCFSHSLEVVKFFRNGNPMEIARETVIEEGDILTVISAVRNMIELDDEYMYEVGEREYLAVEISTKEIIITEESVETLIDALSVYGIVLRSVTLKNGKRAKIDDSLTIEKGMTIKVSGVETSIRKVADKLGYIKEIGSITDIPYVFGALAAAIVFGALKIAGFGLGDSTSALILGLVCGWYYNKKPRYGRYPDGARWVLKSLGLNLFIAAKALTTGSFAMDSKMLLILGIGIAVTLIPHIVTLLFCKYVLKMDDADSLGGQCGSGTCSAALNSLIDSSGSTVFTASYATTNAIANILLTVLGVLLSALL